MLDHRLIYNIDPTRTLTLRNSFVADMNRRFIDLKKTIRKSIIELDCFGLKKIKRIELAELNTTQSKQFAFTRSSDKVKGFMIWLKQQEQKGILEIIPSTQLGKGIEEPWTDKYIQTAYQKGVLRARQEVQALEGSEHTYQDYDVPFQTPYNHPFHIDRLGLLYTRTYNELKGVTDAMDQQISRVLAQGLAQGKNPNDIAYDIVNRVDKIGLTRAKTLARTEIVRAHHQANIQEYKNVGILGVKVKAEWSTAGDSRVCPLCSPLEGKVFTLDEADSIIPVHPNCILDGQIKIYTSKGWKKIKDIVVGEKVLTHKGRFKKVVQLHRNKAQKGDKVTRIMLTGKNNQKMSLSLTDNHPILLDNKWKEIGKAMIGDTVSYLADTCKRCNSLTPYFRTYCSQSCLSKDITDKQWSNPEHRKNISQKAKKQLHREYKLGIRDKDKITKKANQKMRQLGQQGKCPLQRKDVREKIKLATNTLEIRKASSERMKKNNPMKDPVISNKVSVKLKKLYDQFPDKHPNKIMSKKGFISSLEKKVKNILDTIDIKYEAQYKIKRYYVDFAIPSLKIVIECDGEYWHQDKEKDNKRQKEIEKEGWYFLRYSEKQINNNISQIEDELLRVLGNHKKQYKFMPLIIKSIKKWNIKKKITLYNLSVEDDESYIANGFVVHNCRCVVLPLLINS